MRGGYLWRQIVLQFVVPLLVGAALWVGGARIGIIGDLLAGFSVLAGFLFGLVIFVFQLRLGMTSDPRTQSKTLLPVLIDHLFANVLYAVVIAFTLIAVTVVAAATEPHTAPMLTTPSGGGTTVIAAAGVPLGLEPWTSAVVVAVATHLLAVIGMCVSRTRRAYLELRS